MVPPLSDHTLPRFLRVALGLLACVLVAMPISLLLGQDANWDLQNYHFYNPYAFLNNRIDWDIAPAQLQSNFNPLLDLPFYWAVQAGLQPQWIAAMLTIPAGLAAYVYWHVARLLIDDLQIRPRAFYISLCCIGGLTGTMGISLLGSTMNEWPGAALTITALWLILRVDNDRELDRTTLAMTGLLCGVASGLKLTAAPYAVGLCLAILVRKTRFRQALGNALTFGIAVICGLLLAGGWWFSILYRHYASPVFPFFNDWLHSPWWYDVSLSGRIFGPHTFREWLGFPLKLFSTTAWYVTEVAFRDWRIPVLYVAAIATLAVALLRAGPTGKLGMSTRWRVTVCFWLVSFGLWIAQHSIYRYLIPLEMLSAPLLILCLYRLCPERRLRASATILIMVVVVSARYPDFGRVTFGKTFFDVNVPAMPSDAMVLLIDAAPIAYALPYFRSDARFVGANSNLIQPWHQTLLAEKTRRAIRDHQGAMFSLQWKPDSGSAALDSYALRRVDANCTTVRTNMPISPLILCPLERQ